MTKKITKKALFRMATALGMAGFMILFGAGYASRLMPVTQARVQSPAQQIDATVYALTANNNLISFNMLTPGTITRTVAITGLAQGETLAGIDFRPRNNQLYAVSSLSRVYTINVATGAVTAVSPSAFSPILSGVAYGVDFNPVPDRIRLVSDAEQNLRLHPDTGAVAGTDTNLVYATGDPNASANPNIVGAGYTNNVNGATTTTLFVIDSNLDILARQGSPGGAPVSPNSGQLFTVGALGVNTTDQVGLDIIAPADMALASLTVQGATNSGLYSVNLATGNVTLIGAIGGNQIIRDIAVATTYSLPEVAAVNAASFLGETLSPDVISALFGNFQTQTGNAVVASTQPLPTTLGGMKVNIGGTDAPLFFVSNGQVNFRVPSNVPDGLATITVTNANATTRSGVVSINRAAPGLFTADFSGRGPAIGLSTTDGITFTPLTNANGTERIVDPGTRQRPTYLVFFGTGLRNARAENPGDANGVAEAVQATIQGVPATVAYAGRHPDFEGLDQINVILPPELAGLGRLTVRLVVNGQPSNPVTVQVGGQTPTVNFQPIAFGQSINTTLSADDQVLAAPDGSTYFFDAYRFTAVATTTLAADVRSQLFDASVLLYRRNANGTLDLIAADDNLGGLGDGNVANSNALLLTTIQEASEYVLFVTSSDNNPNGTGAYTLRLIGNAMQNISYGATVNGQIAAGDVQTSAGDYLDAYWFAGLQGERVQIRLDSTAFDPALILNRNTGATIATDDNGGGGVNSLINFTLPETGVYVILVTPLAPNRTGAYTLTLNRSTSLQPEALAEVLSEETAAIEIVRVDKLGELNDATRLERFANRRVVQR
jgi:uncharacterized protein (TIGR03437 family)